MYIVLILSAASPQRIGDIVCGERDNVGIAKSMGEIWDRDKGLILASPSKEGLL